MSFCSSAIYAGLVVFTAITIEVCYGNQWGSECSKSTCESVHDLAIAFAFAELN